MSEILTQLFVAANQVYHDRPVLRDLCIAQGILESNLYNTPSQLAVKYNNLFGIKKSGTAGMIYLSTTEEDEDGKFKVIAGFGNNHTLTDSVKQHHQILSLPRYSMVWKADTFERAATRVHLCGYATDRHYSEKLIAVYKDKRFPKNHP